MKCANGKKKNQRRRDYGMGKCKEKQRKRFCRKLGAGILAAAMAVSGISPFSLLGVKTEKTAKAEVATTVSSYVSSDGKRYFYETITSNGAWIVPNGVKKVDVFVCGGGYNGHATGGGNGGKVLNKYNYKVSPGSYIYTSIGGGGGGNTVFGTVSSASGTSAHGAGYFTPRHNNTSEKYTHYDGSYLYPIAEKYWVGDKPGINGQYFTSASEVNGKPVYMREATASIHSSVSTPVGSSYVLHTSTIYVYSISKQALENLTSWAESSGYTQNGHTLMNTYTATGTVTKYEYSSDNPLYYIDSSHYNLYSGNNAGAGEKGVYAFDDPNLNGKLYGSGGCAGVTNNGSCFDYYTSFVSAGTYDGRTYDNYIHAPGNSPLREYLGSGTGLPLHSCGYWPDSGQYFEQHDGADGLPNRGGGGVGYCNSHFDSHNWYGSDNYICLKGAGYGSAGIIIVRWVEGASDSDDECYLGYDVNTNGGESAVPEDIVCTKGSYYDASSSVLQKTASKPGYTFVGWNTNKNATAGLSSLTVNRDTILYAIFRKTLSASFIDYSGSNRQTRDVSKIVYNTEMTANVTPPVQSEATGWTPAGWTKSTARNAEAENSFSIRGGETYYGLYSKSLTATFDAAGGDYVPSPINLTAYANSYNLSDVMGTVKLPDGITKEGYKFVGWAKGSSTGTVYQPGVTVNISSDTKFYAVWSNNLYTVKFSPNGGTGSMDSITCAYDNSIVLPQNEFSKEGYTFAGWSEFANSDSEYEDGGTILNLAESGRAVLYAIWKPNKYTIEYDSNVEPGSVDTMSVSYDENIYLKKNTYTREGYTFKGWSTKPDGKVEYEDHANVKNLSTQGAVRLYALWEPNQYTVRFKSSGGAGEMDAVDAAYDEMFNLPVNSFEKEGNHFEGWALEPISSSLKMSSKLKKVAADEEDSGAAKISDGSSVINLATSGTVNLYAVWGVNDYEIQFDSNGGIGVMKNQQMAYGTFCLLKENSFTRKGYAFTGWATKPTGNVVYTDKEHVGNLVKSGTITLYAKWEKNSSTVRVNPNGGSLKKGNSTLTEATEYAGSYGMTLVLGNPSREGYTFRGWELTNADESRAASGAFADGVYTFGSDNANVDILTAIWKANEYRVEFDFGDGTSNGPGGSGGNSSTTVISYGEDFVLPNCTATKSYTVTLDSGVGSVSTNKLTVKSTFLGWRIDGKIYQPGDSIKNLATDSTAKISVEAVWSDGKVNLPEATRANYVFKGWSTGTDANLLKGSYVPTKDVTLSAIWEMEDANITINVSGATNSQDIKVKSTAGKKLPDLEVTLSRIYKIQLDYSGLMENKTEDVAYEFCGIYSEKNGKGDMYYDAQGRGVKVWNLEGDVTLYAYWKANTITLPEPKSDTYDVTGWKTSEGVKRGIWIPKSSETVTIQLVPKTFKLVFNSVGGVLENAPRGYTYGDSFKLPVPAKEGYVFQGWYCEDGKIDQIDEKTAGDLTLTAKWKTLSSDGTLAGDKDITEIEIPSTMDKVADGYFKDCVNLEKVTIPEGVKEIGKDAFSGCTNLKEVNLPNGLEVIGDSAFKDCTSLKDINLPEGLESIGDHAFSGCTNLRDVVLPSTTVTIGNGAFSDCINLDRIVLNEGLKSLGDEAFLNCKSLTEINIPASVEKIGRDCFKGCDSLDKVWIRNPNCQIDKSPDTFPENATIYGYVPSTAQQYAEKWGLDFESIGNMLSVNFVIGSKMQPVYVMPGGGLPAQVNVPIRLSDKLIEFDCYRFEDGTKVYDKNGKLLLKDYKLDSEISLVAVWINSKTGEEILEVPDGTTDQKENGALEVWKSGVRYKVTKGGALVVQAKKSVSKITIPANINIGNKKYSVSAIGANAFKNCTKLKSVTIPSSIKKLGANAFRGCKNLGKITIKGASLKFGSNALKGTKKGLVVKVPKSKKKQYKKLLLSKGNKTVVIK